MPESTLLVWRDAWSTGVPVIDEQHAALMVEFERLVAPAHRGDAGARRAALDTLTELVCRHFDHEEHLMHVRHYPDLRAHADAHAELLKQLNHFEALLAAQPEGEPGPSIMDFVVRWLLDHIQEDDRRLGAFLRDGPDADADADAERKAS